MRCPFGLKVFLFLSVFSFAPDGAFAQAALREGIRVRISSPGNPRLTGVIQTVTADSIVLYTEPSGIPFRIARSSISALQVSYGRSASRGAKKGAIWGAAAISPLAFLAAGFSGDESVEIVAGVMAEGAVIGALIGAFVKSEKWESVSVKPVVGTRSHGLRLGLRIQ